MKNKRFCFSVLSLLLLAALAMPSLGAGKKKKKKNPQADLNSSAEPDKMLYERSIEDYKHGRYTQERLNLQTLINTYPDSEYLAKAKLAIGDSYFKEGGTSGLTQAVAEYKDFITFFPFLDEAAYAQIQIGVAHYRMLEKPDRDRTQAFLAEEEFQTFLLKYPNSPLAPKAEQKLRDVQEMLGEGDYRVARFYFLKGDSNAAAPRLVELTDRYPLYSQSDKALWMLAHIYEKAEKLKDRAPACYARIIREYPNSPFVPEAKKRLMDAGVPIPRPDPVALARAKEEANGPRPHRSLLHKSWGILKTGPDVSMAARSGQPNLNPEAEPVSAVDVFQPSSKPTGGLSVGGSAGGNVVAVEAVSAGSASAPRSNVTEGASEGSATNIEAAPLNASPAPAPPENPAPASGSAVAPPATNTPGETRAGPASATPEPHKDGAVTGNTHSPDSGITPATTPENKAGGNASSGTPAANAGAKSGKADPKKESTSKKKKGLRKIIPW